MVMRSHLSVTHTIGHGATVPERVKAKELQCRFIGKCEVSIIFVVLKYNLNVY